MSKSPERRLKPRKRSQRHPVSSEVETTALSAKIEESFKENPRKFWNHQKAFLSGRSDTNPAISYDDEVAKKPAQKAKLFNKYLCSVFLPVTLDVNIAPKNKSLRSDMEISQIYVSVDDVREHLNE